MEERTIVYRDLPIDSGQLVIVDPCYLKRWTAPTDSQPVDLESGTTDYEQASRLTCGDKGFGPIDIGGFAVGNFGGDVPVEITVTTRFGRVTSVVLNFEPTSDEDEDEDEEEEDEWTEDGE